MKTVFALVALFLAQKLPPVNPAPDVHLATGVLAHRALERPIAGISLLVAKNGGRSAPLVERAFGFADRDRKVPVTTSTVFHIASVSKHVTAAVVLHLVDAGKLSLDDEVTKYVPEAPTHGRHVTIRQLLNHTSGLHNFTSLPDAEANERLDLTQAQVLGLVKDLPLDFEPGTSWRYSNTGFFLAGMVVERITGTDYATYLRDELFRPLSMTSSSLCTSHSSIPLLASGFDVRQGALIEAAPMTWALPFAAGAICSTAADMGRFEAAIESGRFISRSRLVEMRAATVLSDGTRVDYGLGTRLGSLHGHRVVGHTGNGGGFNAVLESFPDERLTVVVLTNTNNGGALPLSTAIARSAFEATMPAPMDTVLPADESAAVIGVFESDEGPIETIACGEKLCSRRPGTEERREMRRQGRFSYVVAPDTEVRFVAGSDGAAAWAFVYSGGLFVDAKRRLPR